MARALFSAKDWLGISGGPCVRCWLVLLRLARTQANRLAAECQSDRSRRQCGVATNSAWVYLTVRAD